MADALLAGTIGVEQSRRLTELLADNDQSFGALHPIHVRRGHVGPTGIGNRRRPARCRRVRPRAATSAAGVDPSSAARNPAPPPFAFRSFSSLFVANAGFAYLVAVVIMATATIAAHRWGNVVHWRQIAQTAGQLGDASRAQTAPGKSREPGRAKHRHPRRENAPRKSRPPAAAGGPIPISFPTNWRTAGSSWPPVCWRLRTRAARRDP